MKVVNETRNETYKRLAKLAGKAGVDEGKVMELLRISDKPAEGGGLNSGNGVTDDIKLMTRVSRNRRVFGECRWLIRLLRWDRRID